MTSSARAALDADSRIVSVPGTETLEGVETRTPRVRPRRTCETAHWPAPPPASVRPLASPPDGPRFRNPNESVVGEAKTRGRSARTRSTKPPPSRVVEAAHPRVSRARCPVVTSADLTCAGVQVGWRWSKTAAAPATWGAAMLVPLSVCHWPRRLGAADRISTPGAATSGLRRSDSGVGPCGGEARQLPVDRGRGHGDRGRRGAGRRDRSPPEGLEVVPRGDRRHDARGGGAVDGAHDEVTARRDLGLADREVDDIHPVLHSRLDGGGDLGRVAVQPDVGHGRNGQDPVVAEVGPRRDPGQRGSTAAEGHLRPVVPGRDPGDVRAVLRLLGIERELGEARAGGGGREGSSRDHLRGRVGGLALRKAGWHRIPGGIEERMPVVDAVVDDPDLHPLARGRQPGAPEGGRADGGRAPVELGPVARAPVHGGDAVDLLQPSDGTGGDDDRKRVHDDPVTPRTCAAGTASAIRPATCSCSTRRRVSRRSVARASRSSRPCERGSCDRAADGEESSTTTCTRRPSETGAGPRAEASAGSAAKSKTPRKTARLRRGIVRTRRKEFGRSRLYDPVRRKEDRCARHATATAAGPTATARTATARSGVPRGIRRRARLQWPSARMWRNW